MPINKVFLSALEAYKYAYDHGLNFQSNMYIQHCENFTWNEAFVNEPKGIEYVPCLYVFKNLQETFKRLQVAKDKRFGGKRVKIHRAYSSVFHNKKAGSTAELSTHIEGRGVDFSVEEMKPLEFINAMCKKPMTMRVEEPTQTAKRGYCHSDCGDPYHPGGMELKVFGV